MPHQSSQSFATVRPDTTTNLLPIFRAFAHKHCAVTSQYHHHVAVVRWLSSACVLVDSQPPATSLTINIYNIDSLVCCVVGLLLWHNEKRECDAEGITTGLYHFGFWQMKGRDFDGGYLEIPQTGLQLKLRGSGGLYMRPQVLAHGVSHVARGTRYSQVSFTHQGMIDTQKDAVGEE